jgi:hypothetical protein
MILYAYRVFTFFLKMYPELKKVIDEKIKTFIENPESIHKEVIPNIGDLLVYLNVSETYKWEDLKDSYLNEQLDRQVFWILQQIPGLKKPTR